MTSDFDPYSTPKLAIIGSIIINILVIFIPMIEVVPARTKYNLFDMNRIFPDKFIFLSIIALVISTVLYGIAYLKVDTDYSKYFSIASIGLLLLPIYQIFNVMNAINDTTDTDIVSTEFGFFILIIGTLSGLWSILSLPSEEDLIPTAKISRKQPQRQDYQPNQQHMQYIRRYSEPQAEPSPEYVFCGDCGYRSKRGTNFCKNCGSRLKQ